MRIYKVLYWSRRNKHGHMTSVIAKAESEYFHSFLLEGREFAVVRTTVPQSGIFIILDKYEGKMMKTPPL